MPENRRLQEAIMHSLVETEKHNAARRADDKPEILLSGQASLIAHEVEKLLKERIGTIGYALLFPPEPGTEW